MEAKLWGMFEQGGYGLEFSLAVPAGVGNKVVCGLGWGRWGMEDYRG